MTPEQRIIGRNLRDQPHHRTSAGYFLFESVNEKEGQR